MGAVRTVRRLVVLAGLSVVPAACGPVTEPVTGAYGSPGVQQPAAPERLDEHYVVRSGDTLYSIARRADLGLRTVIEANRLAPPYILVPGQQMWLPRLQEHVVQPGDTLYSIARRYDVGQAELVRVNQVPPPYLIRVGERLLLPGQIEGGRIAAQGQTQTASATVSARPLPPPGSPPAADAPPAAVGPGVLQPPPPGPPQTAAGPSSPVPPAIGQPPPPAEAPTAAPAPEAAAVVVPPPPTGSGFLWPVRGKIISSFGAKERGLHNDGINIAAPRGTPILAAQGGVVAYAGNELRGFGNLLLIRHSDGWISAYAHADEILVKRGDRVGRGQTVARVGSSGSVDVPQLHFELRRGKQAVDPEKELPKRESAALSRG